MGSKIFSLQFMRWFFGNRMMQCPFSRGGTMRGRKRRGDTSGIKLIRADGVVKIYEKPIQVSDLVLEFPKHMVCSSDSFYIGQKIPALSNKQRLQPGQSYFLLPNHLFHSVLSFVTLTSFIASTRCKSSGLDDHFQKALLSCQPFQIQKTSSGYLQVNVSEEFISRLMIEGGKPKEDHPLCTTQQLQKDYAQLVAPRIWKPKLETIKEKHEKKRSRRKSQTQKKTPKSRGINQYSSSLSPSVSLRLSSRNKIKAFLATRRKRKQIVL